MIRFLRSVFRRRVIGLGANGDPRWPVYRCDDVCPSMFDDAPTLHCEKPIRHEGPHRNGQTTWWQPHNE